MKALKSTFNLILFFLYPLLVFLFFLISYSSNETTILKEFVALGIFCIILISLIFLFDKNQIRNKLSVLFYSLISFIVFFKSSFLIAYQSPLNASAFYIIFETNTLESIEFLKSYFKVATIVILLLLIVPLFFTKYLFSMFNNRPLILKLEKIIILVLILFCIYVLKYKFNKQDLFFMSYNSFKDYKTFKINKTNLLSSKENKNIKINAITVNSIKKDLAVFSNAYSPHVHTLISLEKILTLSNCNNPNPTKNSSIVQLANSAGYKTFWLSNQNPMGFHETFSSVISNAANVARFISVDSDYYGKLDEALFPFIDESLNDNSSLKTIFIHLSGNHIKYKTRYSSIFNKYKIAKNKKQRIINEYDNSVLYNDFIIHEIIKKVKQNNINANVVYFSDHGDDVFDETDNYGHNEYHGTRPMYEIPLIIWSSNSEKTRNFKKNIEKTYNLDNFYHVFSSIIGVYSEGYNSSLDILSKDFEPFNK